MSNEDKWYNAKVPTIMALLLITLVAVIAGFIIVSIVVNLPISHVSPVFTPRFGTPIN